MEMKEKKIKRLKRSNVSRSSKKIKLCLVSSSGGHYEQLRQLKPLLKKYDGFWEYQMKSGLFKVTVNLWEREMI